MGVGTSSLATAPPIHGNVVGPFRFTEIWFLHRCRGDPHVVSKRLCRNSKVPDILAALNATEHAIFDCHDLQAANAKIPAFRIFRPVRGVRPGVNMAPATRLVIGFPDNSVGDDAEGDE
jgi:hypothetical protein